MSILPESDNILNNINNNSNQNNTTKTFYIDRISNQVIGHCDNLEAIIQSFEFALGTERFKYPCFSGNYGIDLRNLIGNTDDYIISETLERIKDTFKQDNRIKDINLDNQNPFVVESDSIIMNINVETIFGKFDYSLEVQK